MPNTPPPGIDREKVLDNLRLNMPIFYDDLVHLRIHPEDMRWPQEKAEPNCFARLESHGIRLPEDEEHLTERGESGRGC